MRKRNREKIEVYMPDEMKAKLQAASLKTGMSMAKIVKTTLDLYLKEDG